MSDAAEKMHTGLDNSKDVDKITGYWNINPLHPDTNHSSDIQMAGLLRLVIVCLCVAATFAAVLGDDPQPEPTQPPAPTPAPPACTEGDRRGDATDCHKFTECKKGVWADDRCFWFRKFDSEAKKCVMWGAKCTTN